MGSAYHLVQKKVSKVPFFQFSCFFRWLGDHDPDNWDTSNGGGSKFKPSTLQSLTFQYGFCWTFLPPEAPKVWPVYEAWKYPVRAIQVHSTCPSATKTPQMSSIWVPETMVMVIWSCGKFAWNWRLLCWVVANCCIFSGHFEHVNWVAQLKA